VDNHSLRKEGLVIFYRQVPRIPVYFFFDNPYNCRSHPPPERRCTVLNVRDKAAVNAVIQDRHWGKGESIRAIERALGLTATRLNFWCKYHGIVLRTKEAQCAITNRDNPNRARGERHWAWGRRKSTDAWAARNSERMTTDNPVRKKGVMIRIARTWADTMRNRPTLPEATILGLLSVCGVPFAYQHPVGRYVIDFAFPAYHLAFELDGKAHECAARHARDLVRDRALIRKGWKVLRVPQRNLKSPGHFLAVLKEHVPDLQIPSDLPSVGRKYRVLFRDAKYPAGIKV
jgi:very-short-patch-repair endonuclease